MDRIGGTLPAKRPTTFSAFTMSIPTFGVGMNNAAPGDMFVHSILLGTDFARHNEIVNDRLRFVIGKKAARTRAR